MAFHPFLHGPSKLSAPILRSLSLHPGIQTPKTSWPAVCFQPSPLLTLASVFHKTFRCYRRFQGQGLMEPTL